MGGSDTTIDNLAIEIGASSDESIRQIERVIATLRELRMQMAATFAGGQKVDVVNTDGVDQAKSRVNDFNKTLSRTKEEAKQSGRALKDNFKEAEKSVNNATSGIGKMFASLKRIAYYRLIRSAIRAITQGFKEGLENAHQFSKINNGPLAQSLDKLSTAAFKMKNQLGAAFGQLLVAVTPVLIQLADLITLVADRITQLLAALSGQTTYMKAVDYWHEWGGAAEDAGQQAQAALRYLAPFDELNVLPSAKSNGSGSGSDEFDYSQMYVEAEIDEFWQKLGGFLNDLGTAISIAIESLGFNWDDLDENAIQHALLGGIGGILGFALTGNIGGALLGTIAGVGISLLIDKLFPDESSTFGGMTGEKLLGGVAAMLVGAGILKTIGGAAASGAGEYVLVGAIAIGAGLVITRVALENPTVQEWLGLLPKTEDRPRVYVGLPGTIEYYELDPNGNPVYWYVNGKKFELKDGVWEEIVEELAPTYASISVAITTTFEEAKTGFSGALSTLSSNINNALEQWRADNGFTVDPDVDVEFKPGSVSFSSEQWETFNPETGEWEMDGKVVCRPELDPAVLPVDVPSEATVKTVDTSKVKGTKFDAIASLKAWRYGWKETPIVTVVGKVSKAISALKKSFGIKATANVTKTKNALKNVPVIGAIAGFTKTSTKKLSAKDRLLGMIAQFTKTDKTGLSESSRTINATANINNINVTASKPEITITGKVDKILIPGGGYMEVKANGGVFSGGRWHDVAAYAGGNTSIMGGQLFVAREAGPELVGTLGGHTAVMNNNQIVASVASGVASANEMVVSAVMSAAAQIVNAINSNGNSNSAMGSFDAAARAVTIWQRRNALANGAGI